MSISLLIIIACVVAAGGAVVASPGKSFQEALSISGKQAIRVLPIVLPAMFIAGFLAELLPKELVAGLVGAESGWTGFALAIFAGAILPTGPMVVLPLGAALLQADAGLAQVLTLYTAWTVVNLQRLFIWELPLVGPSLAIRRYIGGWVILPFAIVSAILIAAALGR